MTQFAHLRHGRCLESTFSGHTKSRRWKSRLGENHHTFTQGSQVAWRSLFRKPRLAQAFVAGRKVVGDVLSIPFDGEARIEAKGFGDERLRLVHLAQKRIGGGEVGVVPVGVIAGVDRLSVFDDCRFGTTSANFYIAELRVIK